MFMFGPQAPDFANVNESIVSIFRYMMYDYDRDAMVATFPTGANVFYGSFMVLMTNLVLWMFLAIILESYTEIRARSQGAPTLYDDALAYAASLPPLRSWPAYASCGLAGARAPGIEAVLAALKTAPDAPRVLTPAALVALVPRLGAGAAEGIVTDALAWSLSLAAKGAAAAAAAGADAGAPFAAAGAGAGALAAPPRAAALSATLSAGGALAGPAPLSYSEARSEIARLARGASSAGGDEPDDAPRARAPRGAPSREASAARALPSVGEGDA
jgi:hypothetical protein